MKNLLIGSVAVAVLGGCATTMIDARSACSDGSRLGSFANDDFEMTCQEYKTVEYIGNVPQNSGEDMTEDEYDRLLKNNRAGSGRRNIRSRVRR